MALHSMLYIKHLVLLLFQFSPFSVQNVNGYSIMDLTPETILSEILPRLPIQDRLRFRSTCSNFVNLIEMKKLPEDTEEALLGHISSEKAIEICLIKQVIATPCYYHLDFYDAEDRGLLFWAVFLHGSLELVHYLFQKGASLTNPRVMKRVFECIMYCRNGHSILRFMIENGCLLGVHGQWNFLSLVVLMSKGPFFDILLDTGKIGEWINSVDSEGRTPLFSAKRYNVAQSLLENGANVLVRDYEGNTARQTLRNELRSSVDTNLDELLRKAEAEFSKS